MRTATKGSTTFPGDGPYTFHERKSPTEMSVVYKAWDVKRDCPVCVKALHPNLSGNKAARERFALEVKLGRQLNHPNLLRVEDADLTADPPYLVTDWVEGQTLDELPKGLSLARLLRLAIELCNALQYLHELGYIHKDLKRANVVLETKSWRAVLIDLGIAFPLSGQRHTAVGYRTGSPTGYYPPEVSAGKPPTVRDELYALGNLLKDVSTPADREYPASHLPTPLVALIDELLSPAPGRRPRSAAEVKRRLERVAHPVPKRSRMLWASVMFAFVFVLVALAGFLALFAPQTVVALFGATARDGDKPAPTVPPATPAEVKNALAEAVAVGKGTRLEFHHPTITDADLREAIKGQTKLQVLDLDGCSTLSDAVAEVVEANPGLHTMRADGVNLSEAAVLKIAARLGGETNTEKVLKLSGKGLTLKAMGALVAIPKVVELYVTGCEINGDICDTLSNQSTLRRLTITRTKSGRATGTDYAKLGRLRELVDLNLTDTPVDDTAADGLALLTKLRSLTLAKTDITDKAGASIALLIELRGLDLEECGQFGDKGLALLKGLKQLEYLSLDRTAVSDAGTAVLQEFPRLAGLSVRFTKITDRSAARLAAIPKLDSLFLHGCDAGDPTLRALVAERKRYKQLVVTGPKVTNEGVKELAVVEGLLLLSLYETAADDNCVDYLAKLKGLKQLDVQRSKITADGVKRLKRVLPECQVAAD